MDYHTKEVVSIDMKACYPDFFQAMGEAKPYFGHPTWRMSLVLINDSLPEDMGTGYADAREWEFAVNSHPVVPA